MISKNIFYFFLGIIVLSAGFYAFKKYGPERLYGTQVKMEIFCDELFGQNSFPAAEEIIDEKCRESCAKIKMDFEKYDCKVGKNLVCDCK